MRCLELSSLEAQLGARVLVHAAVVLIQVALGSEGPVTTGALERPFTGVGAQVDFEVCRPAVALVTAGIGTVVPLVRGAGQAGSGFRSLNALHG